jgi:hypothetical protein
LESRISSGQTSCDGVCGGDVVMGYTILACNLGIQL